MNERIRQLAEQAITEKLSLEEFIEALKKEPNDFYGFRVSELQKFAELIVRECWVLVDYDNKQYIKAQFKEYFGVEE